MSDGHSTVPTMTTCRLYRWLGEHLSFMAGRLISRAQVNARLHHELFKRELIMARTTVGDLAEEKGADEKLSAIAEEGGNQAATLVKK
jgi:hypothetical protein